MEKSNIKGLYNLNKKGDNYLFKFLKSLDTDKMNKENPYILENCEVYENKKIIGLKIEKDYKITRYNSGIEISLNDVIKYEFLIIKMGLLLDYSGNLRKKEEFDMIIKSWNKNEKEGKVFIYDKDIILKK